MFRLVDHQWPTSQKGNFDRLMENRIEIANILNAIYTWLLVSQKGNFDKLMENRIEITNILNAIYTWLLVSDRIWLVFG